MIEVLHQRNQNNEHRSSMEDIWRNLNNKKPEIIKQNTIISSRCFSPGRDITKILRRVIDKYFNQIEKITKRHIFPKQRFLIKQYVYSNDIKKLSSQENAHRRKNYHRHKKELIQDWEKNTGFKWPVYKKEVRIKGEIVRQIGKPYDVHHIVELSYGGPNVWWNLHPASFPIEHQQGIHSDKNLGGKLFGH